MSALGNANLLPPQGVCFGCGCTDARACLDPDTRQPCHWANAEETCCSVCALRFAEKAGLVIEEVFYQ